MCCFNRLSWESDRAKPCKLNFRKAFKRLKRALKRACVSAGCIWQMPLLLYNTFVYLKVEIPLSGSPGPGKHSH